MVIGKGSKILERPYRIGGAQAMDFESRITALLDAAKRLEIDVRFEPMGGSGGGLCTLGGRHVLFVDTSADLDLRYERLVSELAALDAFDDVYLVPEVRDDIEHFRARRP